MKEFLLNQPLKPYSVNTSEKKQLSENAKPAVSTSPPPIPGLEPHIPKKNLFTSRLGIGGIRVNGAIAVASDTANTPSGYSRQDGIYLSENMVFGTSATW